MPRREEEQNPLETRMDKIRHEDSRVTAQAKQFGDKAREVTKA